MMRGEAHQKRESGSNRHSPNPPLPLSLHPPNSRAFQVRPPNGPLALARSLDLEPQGQDWQCVFRKPGSLGRTGALCIIGVLLPVAPWVRALLDLVLPWFLVSCSLV